MPKISDFLMGYKGTTRLGYRSSIYQLLDSRYGNVRAKKDSSPEEQERYEELAEDYFKGDVKPLEDLKAFKDHLFAVKRPPHSISQSVACVKIWMEHYDRPLTSKDLRELKKYMPRQRAGVTREDEVTADTIRQILSHTGDVRLRAACLLMLSSGIRIGEMIQLTDDDIDWKKNTVHISDLISKTGEQRVTFFTDETKEALQQYLAEREMFMTRAVKMAPRLGQSYPKGRNELFPTSTCTLRKGFISTLKRASLYREDKRTNRTTIHPHSFRKFFNSTLKMAGCPEDVVEELMGHGGYLSTSYRRYGDSQLREIYEKYSHVLTIGDYGYEVRQELKARVDSQMEKVIELEQKNAALMARLQKIEALQEFSELPADSGAMGIIRGVLTADQIREMVNSEVKRVLAGSDGGE